MTKIPSVEEKQQSEEWGAWKFVSEMFDVPHPDKDLANCGIYNTSKCYEQIHDFVVEQKAKARTALLTELREMIDRHDPNVKMERETNPAYWGNTLRAELDKLINPTGV